MKLSKEQKLASESFSGPNMVIAVPGAGKTTILLKRIENLINKGVAPEKILTITFSKAAATELQNRFLTNFPNLKTPPHFFTIHAFSYKILRDYGRKKGIDYKLLEGSKEISKYGLLGNIYREIHKDYINEERLEILVNKIGYLKNMMLSPDESNFQEIDKFKEIFEKYEAFKKKYKYIDFDDMLELALKVLLSDNNLKQKYVNMYDYIQVDEGQDTSKLQMEIIKLLTKKKRNLFIVADDDQSIYSFRGADPQGLFDLESFFPDLKTHYMQTNFRSSKNIVAAANNFIDQNKIRYDKCLISNRDYETPVEVVKVGDLNREYEFLVEEISKKDPKTCAILYRNNISAVGVVEHFEREKIPFNIGDTSRIKFYSHRISQDILSILYFSEDLYRLDLFEQIYYKIKGYISKLMINNLKASGKTGNVLETLLDIGDLQPYSRKEISNLIQSFKRLKALPMDKKIQFIGEDLGYLDFLKFNSKKESLGLQGELLFFENIKKIAASSKDINLYNGRLRYLDNLLIRTKKSNSGITLSTIHSAKGKEFEHVYIIDLYDGMFPGSGSKEKNPLILEEERRLFYVGMTRAKNSLTILYPAKVGEEKTEISKFLTELANSCN